MSEYKSDKPMTLDEAMDKINQLEKIADFQQKVIDCKVTLIDRALERADKAERILHDLTPGGSEFYNNPETCVIWVRDKLKRHEDHFKRLVSERNQAQANEAMLRVKLEKVQNKTLLDELLLIGVRFETLMERCVRAENGGEISEELMERLWGELVDGSGVGK